MIKKYHLSVIKHFFPKFTYELNIFYIYRNYKSFSLPFLVTKSQLKILKKFSSIIFIIGL